MAQHEMRIGALIDPATHQRTADEVKIATADFTTHGVIVGMTGSGKTGLGVVLLEEALNADIPAIIIDPKGDLTNLLLTFPDFSATDFRPWVNESDAQKAGVSVDDFAAQQAKTWQDGLASWNIDSPAVASYKNGRAFTIYTPGSTSGVPINIVGSLNAPVGADNETINDEIEGYVTGLLSLVGIDSDPLSSREHILLSNLINASWTQGRNLDLPTLVGQVATPPIRKLGVFELDQFFPPDDRMKLAMKLNGLLASASFAAWAEGQPIDVEALLHTPEGKPRAAVISIAHLSDQERQFVVSIVLSKIVTWMRKQSGTTDLRAIVYMDEVAGYVPPTAMPPSKKPIMLLMKQARAFGVGVILATQNPVDLDYKAISNAGTWMIGRLQTAQDKSRLIEGLSAADGGVDVSAIDATISALGKREFVLRKVGSTKPAVFSSRWAMSYLRGPLTKDQVSQLMAGERAAAQSGPASDGAISAPASAQPSQSSAAPLPSAAPSPAQSAVPMGDGESPIMPQVAAGVRVVFLDPAAPWGSQVGATPGTRFEAAAVARLQLLFDDEKSGLREQEEWEAVIFPLHESVGGSDAVHVDFDDRDLRSEVPTGASYTMSAAKISDKKFWADLNRDLIDNVFRNRTVEVFRNKDLKLMSRPGESSDDFKARCHAAADAESDKEAAGLKSKYDKKVSLIQTQVQVASDKVNLLHDQQRSSRGTEILSVAGSILGSLLGGRSNAGSLVRGLGGAASRRGRTAAAGDRVDSAENVLAAKQQTLTDVEAELENELVAIVDAWSTKAENIDSVQVALEKTDIKVDDLVLCWIPVA